MKNKSAITRKFLGKTEGFIDKEERVYEQKHLKAYLKGQTRFVHGTIPYEHPLLGAVNIPKFCEVKQETNTPNIYVNTKNRNYIRRFKRATGVKSFTQTLYK